MVLFKCRRALELCEFLTWRKYKRSDLLKLAAAANLFIWLSSKFLL